MNENQANKPGKVTAADGHVYHKSATANATVAPTNEATTANAAKTGSLTANEAEFVTILDYEWGLGTELSRDYLIAEYGFDPEALHALIASPAVNSAAIERGINPACLAVVELPSEAKPTPKGKLTPLQVVVANTLLDLSDTRSNAKKLKDAGITTYRYNNWLKDADFQHYIRTRAENLLGDIQHEALLALVDKVTSGDLKAIEYYHEITGRYIRQPAASTQVNVIAQDTSLMITRIIEVIVDEVEDQALAERIAGRLKGLVMGNNAALTANEPIVVPAIAAPRVITPEVQTLMDRGVGYDS